MIQNLQTKGEYVSIANNRKDLDHKLGISSIPTRLHYPCKKCKKVTSVDLYSKNIPECCGIKFSRFEDHFFTFDAGEILKLRLPHVQRRTDFHHTTAINNLNVEFTNQDYTITMNTDGAPIFKSSNSSLWPILGKINEAKNLRTNETLLFAVWIGKKPNVDIFLQPLMDQMKTLAQHGLEWRTLKNEVVISRFYILCVLCDSVARPMVQKMTQFNGKFGCGYCYYDTPGIFLPSVVMKLRSHEEYLTDLACLQNQKMETYRGLRGLSPLLSLSYFNMIDGKQYDYQCYFEQQF